MPKMLFDETKKPTKVKTGLEEMVELSTAEIERRRANPTQGLPSNSESPPREDKPYRKLSSP